MREEASLNTIRLVHEFMRLAEGQPLQEVKDAICNMLASIIIGQPDMRSIGEAEEHARFCLKDVKKAMRSNWERRQLHQIEQ